MAYKDPKKRYALTDRWRKANPEKYLPAQRRADQKHRGEPGSQKRLAYNARRLLHKKSRMLAEIQADRRAEAARVEALGYSGRLNLRAAA